MSGAHLSYFEFLEVVAVFEALEEVCLGQGLYF